MLERVSQHRKDITIWLTLTLILGLVSACAPPRKVAVEERTTVNPRLEVEDLGGAHIRIVQPGDTLYGIAFENGLDANRLAAWNGIENKNRLPVGKRLRLTKPVGFVMPTQSKTTVKTASPRSAPDKPVSQTKPTKPSQSPAVKKNKPALAKERRDGSIRWRWPTKGEVIQSFSSKGGQQGIDISGVIGQPVLAAANGEVVYVGNGLKGYGNLVILKHDEVFLSAYAHNQETFVQEGQQITAAQRIGTVGKNRAGVNALHFQIRRHGEPVNPMDYFQK